jgi:hypothetical protein
VILWRDSVRFGKKFSDGAILEVIFLESHSKSSHLGRRVDGHKHNSTMVSNTSPGTIAPQMSKSFAHIAHVSSDHACPQDGYLKRPHPTIIDGDMRRDSG